MRASRPCVISAFLAAACLVPACTAATGGEQTPRQRTPARAAAESVATLAPTFAPTPAPTPTPRPRIVTDTAWRPFASVGGVTLVHPSARVERVAFHESNHDGARQLELLPGAVAPVTLETRERGTGSRTAADIVSHPGIGLRSPVTGTVKRAGSYVLYCDWSDGFVVIEPDAHPGWEVKLLHIHGVRVRPGARVVAGQTQLADRPSRLAFESQVDELSPGEAWPHVHVEVVDPSIPDRPTPGGGCK